MEITTTIVEIETESEITEIIVEIETEAEITAMMTETEIAETTTTVSTADLSSLAEIDVDLLNTFLYLGCSFILVFFFFSVCKGLYRFLNMFF